eukprot:2732349-Pyramimonas_sp.AAC.1
MQLVGVVPMCSLCGVVHAPQEGLENTPLPRRLGTREAGPTESPPSDHRPQPPWSRDLPREKRFTQRLRE